MLGLRINLASMDMLQRLPEDLVLRDIFPRLDSTSRIRAAAVSRMWRDLSRRAPPPARGVDGGVPWIWLSDELMNHSLLQPPPSSSSASTAASSFAEAMAGGVVVGCHLQYSLIVRRPPSTSVVLYQDIFLLHDPFSGQSFPLPRMIACDYYRAVCLSASSSTPDSYPHKFPPNFVAAVAEPCLLVLIYRPDLDDDWKVAFNTPKAQDLIFHGDELYCVNREREIRAIHVRTPNLHVNADRTVVTARGHHNEDGDNDYINSDDNIINPDVFVMHYLVESCRGELLLVSRYDLDYNKIRFEVHRVVEEGGLVEVVDLGHDMLFVREGCSRSWSGRPPLMLHEFFTNNSIYFFRRDRLDGRERFSLGKFTLSSSRRDDNFATFHPLPLPSAFRPCWITPILTKTL